MATNKRMSVMAKKAKSKSRKTKKTKAELKGGGWVLKMKHHPNWFGHIKVDNDTLRKVVEALGIPQRAPKIAVDSKGISEIESIYIHRGD